MGNSFDRATDTRTTGAGTAESTGPIPADTIPADTIPAQRSAPPATEATDGGTPATEASATGVHYCRCGHDAATHEHFRAGSECATCDCTRYNTTGRLAALLASTVRRGR